LAERPAVNASPLIHLAGADLLSFLQLAAPEIVVPRPVAEEIRAGGSVDAAARARISAARPVLEAMRGSGMYLSESVLDKALVLVGE
jgi:predicted nucleic acid-binding protein